MTLKKDTFDVELLGAALRLALQKGKIARAPRMPAKLSEKDNVGKGFFEKAELDALLPHLPTPRRHGPIRLRDRLATRGTPLPLHGQVAAASGARPARAR